MPRWDDIHLFLQVARSGSIRAASRVLDVDHAAISRRLARFETEFGTRLLHRRAKGQILTAAGLELLVAAEAMEVQAQKVERRLSGFDANLDGWVRVSCNTPLGLRLLMPVVASCTARHPGLQLEVSLSQNLANIENNDADVALRIGVAPPEGVIALRLCGFAVATYASTPSPDHWIGWDPAGPYDAFLREAQSVRLPVRHRFTDDLMLVEAAKHGLGAIAVSCLLGDAEPGLVRLGPCHPVASVYVLRHPDHRSTARIRAFVACVVSCFAELAPLIEGRRPQPLP